MTPDVISFVITFPFMAGKRQVRMLVDIWTIGLMGKKAEIWTAKIKAASLGGCKFHEDVP
jgi:hypothetical protein